MHNKETLLLEKRRYGLPQTVSTQEQEWLDKSMPVQKIIGYIEMANVIIDISQNVLIPRYETEELIYEIFNNYPKEANLKIFDLCTGSGFIGLALKKHFINSEVTMSDISNDSIIQSRINKLKNNLSVKIIQSDLFENINDTYDFIVCNPPYISFNEKLDKSVIDFEPYNALFAENDGLYFYEKIIKEAKQYLTKEGKIFFEINPKHINWWNQQKNNYEIKIIKDINKKDRIVIFSYK
ncbi:peptide chain release factor N(5)-glutamine methyltransferase [Mycoplasmopsis felis]|uniref:peptide chain release factor N(5)-glutamine methyltransferase n=1 Tax=Mycoplasmopsis felis TaxID=33923 RepID=UPI002AFE2F91|nr:peptide chain release factor N(5)-glutamine methyltransferase [Mycoplasmopsis felis]WQQ02896.1 peptide chain release factor N(5)-glutamine methyltransferase [Mycoplasmopsis felis]WQQ06745.1 peptide chain release factor N(5)-glutamine methyltransferase [Mycoplasmopsis felis]WQQ10625.1 peptide chain release factor N(5)-glutamine methyltransferase [Mycoplasmopsis felis]